MPEHTFWQVIYPRMKWNSAGEPCRAGQVPNPFSKVDYQGIGRSPEGLLMLQV